MEARMRHLLIAGVLVLTSTATSAAQAQQLDVSQAPLNATFRATAQVEEVMTFVARLATITIEFDTTVTEEIRRAPLAKPLRLINATVEEAIDVLTSTNGLTYTIIGPKAIRISRKP
jgi:hypothetical protein